MIGFSFTNNLPSGLTKTPPPLPYPCTIPAPPWAQEEAAAPYVRLLAVLVRREGALVGEHVADLKVGLEHLALLPPAAALSLLLAAWPLARARRDVRDYLVMLLRKAMFR